jgi:tungstate transport system substrate-binding protein
LVGAVVAVGRPGGSTHAQERAVVLATTTSVRDAGLLDVLLPAFERTSGLAVKVVAVGSGQAMELGRRGEADLLILHDPAGEERFVADGFGIDRRPLMHNEFVVVGPPDDPAEVRGPDAVRALRQVAAREVPFVSRGDRSGTHVKELDLWSRTGSTPEGDWYRESGQGMGATLVIVDQLRAYALSDIATFLNHRFPLELEILVQGDPLLRNPYHVVRANPERFPHVHVEGARALAEYLLSPEVQTAIGEFKRAELGRSVFVPDGNRR